MAEQNRKKADGRGGYRPNSGRKPELISVKQVRELRETAKRLAKKHGKTIFELIGEWMYDENLHIRERQTAAKMFLDKYMISVSEGGAADQNAGPEVFLPEHRAQLEVVKDDKAA